MSVQTDFIQTIAPLAVNEYLSRENWVLPSVCIAMAALESGWNLNASTLFGIKGEGVTATTSEYLNGHWVEIQDTFQAYPSVAASVVGFYDFIDQTPWYHDACNDPNPASVLHKLEHPAMGENYAYATAPNYESVVLSIIASYNLTQYDTRTGQEHSSPSTNSPQEAPRLANEEVAMQVIRGDWGNDPERSTRLRNAGYDRDIIQSIVDNMLNADTHKESKSISNKVSINQGATDLNTGSLFAEWVYTSVYDVIEINGSRVVFGLDGVVTGAVDIKSVTFR